MEKIKGILKRFSKAESKKGRKYMQIMVEDVFMFYWGDTEKLGEFEERDYVEAEYSGDKYKTLSTIKKLENSSEEFANKNKNKIKELIDYMGDRELGYNDIIDYLKMYGLNEGEAEKFLLELLKIGEIFEIRPGVFMVLK